MKARMPAGFGRPDMNALMRQAQKMQEDMKALIRQEGRTWAILQPRWKS